MLFTLGLIDRLAGLADASADLVGLEFEGEHLPQRIRLPLKAKPPASGKAGRR